MHFRTKDNIAKRRMVTWTIPQEVAELVLAGLRKTILEAPREHRAVVSVEQVEAARAEFKEYERRLRDMLAAAIDLHALVAATHALDCESCASDLRDERILGRTVRDWVREQWPELDVRCIVRELKDPPPEQEGGK